MILNIFIISIIWVLILDLCGFARTIDKTLYKIFYPGRPFREDAQEIKGKIFEQLDK